MCAKGGCVVRCVWWGCAGASGCAPCGSCSEFVPCVPTVWATECWRGGECACVHTGQGGSSVQVCGEWGVCRGWVCNTETTKEGPEG